MAKPRHIELADGEITIPILYEDRSVLAIDKPPGWMLAPESWDRTGRNLNLALQSSIQGRDYWATSRNLNFLRFVHRLDADTSGIILFAKSPGALRAYSEMFEEREVEKHYIAVVEGVVTSKDWSCTLDLEPDPGTRGRMRVSRSASEESKPAETNFRLLQAGRLTSLVEAMPVTGRTHQIRVHLLDAGHPVVGDPLYGSATEEKLALRAFKLIYRDPFQKKVVRIFAPIQDFLRDHGFEVPAELQKPKPKA